MSLSMIVNISGLPRVKAWLKGNVRLVFWELWFDVVLIRFISLATVSMKVLGFEFAINVRELRAILHESAIGTKGKLIEVL